MSEKLLVAFRATRLLFIVLGAWVVLVFLWAVLMIATQSENAGDAILVFVLVGLVVPGGIAALAHALWYVLKGND